VVMRYPGKNDVLGAARRQAENGRRRVADELSGVFSVGIRAHKLRQVGCEQAAIGGPIEKLDVFSARCERTDVGGRTALAGQNIKIAYRFLLNGGQSFAVGRETQSRIAVDVAGN